MVGDRSYHCRLQYSDQGESRNWRAVYQLELLHNANKCVALGCGKDTLAHILGVQDAENQRGEFLGFVVLG